MWQSATQGSSVATVAKCLSTTRPASSSPFPIFTVDQPCPSPVVTVANPGCADIARLAAVGGNVYSFTLFWTRIYPWALANTPLNQAGVDHYRDVIDYAWSQGVEPVVTLFHWDTPLAAQLAYGGFASERIVDDFVNYAVSGRLGTACARELGEEGCGTRRVRDRKGRREGGERENGRRND